MSLQDIYNNNSMLEALKLQHFDKVISANRIICGYSETTQSFRSPSVALQCETNLSKGMFGSQNSFT